MTLARFVTKNAFRNKRRSVLTALSIAFSLLLLTIMMTVWRAFYLEQGSPESAQRLITRHKVSLVFFLPAYYREKFRALPGVKSSPKPGLAVFTRTTNRGYLVRGLNGGEDLITTAPPALKNRDRIKIKGEL